VIKKQKQKMYASSSKDAIKKFHSLTPSSPVDARSNVFQIPAVDPANNNSNEVEIAKPKLSASSHASSKKSSRKNRRKQKERRVAQENEKDEEVDGASLQLFESSGASSCVNFCPAEGLFIHGYGAIPVIKGDFKILPEKAQVSCFPLCLLLQMEINCSLL
jgi:hypothetical protein